MNISFAENGISGVRHHYSTIAHTRGCRGVKMKGYRKCSYVRQLSSRNTEATRNMFRTRHCNMQYSTTQVVDGVKYRKNTTRLTHILSVPPRGLPRPLRPVAVSLATQTGTARKIFDGGACAKETSLSFTRGTGAAVWASAVPRGVSVFEPELSNLLRYCLNTKNIAKGGHCSVHMVAK